MNWDLGMKVWGFWGVDFWDLGCSFFYVWWGVFLVVMVVGID